MSDEKNSPEKGHINLGLRGWKKALLISAVVLALLMGILAWIWIGFEVKDVSVTGNKHYTVEQIRNMIMEGPLGKNSLYLYFKYRNREVEGVPFVETMDVKILSPGSISITVYEKAIAGCVGYLDRYMYFDKDGIVVESSEVRQMDLPYVGGLEFDHVVLYEKLPVENDEIFKDILTITQLLTKYGIQSDRIEFDSDGNVTLFFDKARVKMGSLTDIDEKMIKLQGIVPKLDGLEGVLYMDNYVSGEEDKYITFQRD